MPGIEMQGAREALSFLRHGAKKEGRQRRRGTEVTFVTCGKCGTS